jgi:hypothetical protein
VSPRAIELYLIERVDRGARAGKVVAVGATEIVDWHRDCRANFPKKGAISD